MYISKSKVEIYKLQDLNSRDFADITIDEGEKSGRISIASSFGTWSNYWGACGESFKAFLCGLDIHYSATKFEVEKWIDLPKTIEKFKSEIIDARKMEHISSEEARIIMNELKAVENSNQRDYAVIMNDQKKLLKFFDYMPDTQTDIHPQFKAFWTKMWLPFVEHLKKEHTESLLMAV